MMVSNEPAPTRWQKFRMLAKVVELRLRFIALMAATAGVFAYWDTLWNHYEKWSRPAGPSLAAAPSATEYFCPMHPTVIQGEPGSCPICGMPLSKRPRGQAQKLPPGVLSRVTLAPLRVAQAGVQTDEVAYAPLDQTLTTVGSVEVDERQMRRISSKIRGLSRVETLFVNFTGTRVQAGQPLAEVYSSELYQALQELLLSQSAVGERSRAQTSIGRSVLGEAKDVLRLAVDRLKLWGITQEQIDRVLRENRADLRLPILSPISGVVLRKNVVEGQYVAEGEAMFEVADLSRVWVKAQVFENQIALVREGQGVEATVEAYPGEVFKGRVAFVDPVLDPKTRTVTVRYDLDNADLRLLPGMFATVSLKTPVAETPAWLARHAPRQAAETQEYCLVTNLKLGSMGKPVPVEVQGQQVLICCENCEDKLRQEPAKFLARLAPAPTDEVLSVPESAVIDTGAMQVVYVETEPGIFEGRQVVLGPISANRYPVLEGVRPGEKIATAGAFLIDAENRLNPAAAASTQHPNP